MKLSKTLVKRCITVIDAGLVSGLGRPVPGEMCIEAAICFALGLPHGDDPQCVAKSVRSLKIKLNDAAWSSTQARAKGLRKLAILQLGTSENFDEIDFAKRVSEMTIRAIVPLTLRKAASLFSNEHKEKLLEAAKACEITPTKSAAESAWSAARSAAESAEWSARSAWSAARSAAESARSAARSAAESAEWSARSAAESAEWSARSAGDEVLFLFAEEVAKILISMKVPGAKYLYLLEE